MNTQINTKKKSFKIGKVLYALAPALLFSFVNPIYAADRFAPPPLGAPLSNFDKRFNSSQLNVSFIVARVLNESRIIHRASDDIKRTTALFRNKAQAENNTGSVSNSVIIPPGTKADTIIIINQNDGDSYAIHR